MLVGPGLKPGPSECLCAMVSNHSAIEPRQMRYVKSMEEGTLISLKGLFCKKLKLRENHEDSFSYGYSAQS